MIARVSVKVIRRNAIWMDAQSSARLVLQGVMGNAESGGVAILLREVSVLGVRV
jgi:hypothetical protein